MVVNTIARRIFGTANDRRVKKFHPNVVAINALEPDFEKLTDDELKAKTGEFRTQIANGATLEQVLVPAFATVREAAKRTLAQRHYDVQLIGGMVLNERAIAEMRTGEGKTLASTLPVYLNALNGKGVHVVTVNDYLAKRDAEWMGEIYRFLGMTVGTVLQESADEDRQAAYAADITYGTNNQFGFDYLRDNMKYSRDQMVQRGHVYAIVDEVDSILVDEARTPLIISGPSEDRSDLYQKIDAVMPIIEEGDFELDEKQRAATFTDQGVEKLEARLTADGLLTSESLYDIENVSIVHHLNSALRAHKLFQRDKDYIVRNDEVVIIDEFTGRMMPGRRYSEGLHQALEAKEHVKIQPENQTLASITFQNYFRLYDKLAGMTGTASTEEEELGEIYGLEVITVPTNLPIARVDDDDAIFRTVGEKFDAIAELVADAQKRGQPVLVGTTSIEKSEVLADALKKKGVKDLRVLNARHHEQEAYIIAEAGVPGAVTIATNMAGRGTDIQLGGNVEMRLSIEAPDAVGEERKQKIEEIKASIAEKKQAALRAGGLLVVGTERHESRRIDNQLRGRSGRQGDPGQSRFFLSLQDDLMRIFAVETMDSMLEKLGLEKGESITHPWVSKAIEKSQAKVEARNFDIRKNILKYDDVMNDQRKVIFEQRLELMDEADVTETLTDMRHDVVASIVSRACPERTFPEQWNTEQLAEAAKTYLNIDVPAAEWAAEEGIDAETIVERLTTAADDMVERRRAKIVADGTAMGHPDPRAAVLDIEKRILLQSIDGLWREHLVTLDHLSKVVGWRGLAQRDPLVEYKQEAYDLFNQLLTNLRELVTTQVAHLRIEMQQPQQPQVPEPENIREVHIDPTTGENEVTDDARLKPLTAEQLKGVRRNDPCPCGSGKKFKHCHGAY